MTNYPKCNSENIDVTGIYIHCKDCDFIDDSTFDQIMENAIKI